MTKKVLVTGAAGFIGFHVAQRLLAAGAHVVGLDEINDYYDPQLKEARLAQLLPHESFTFAKVKLQDTAEMDALFAEHQFDTVINLAAQAGVRYSLENPRAYIDSNIVGFLNILEGCRHSGVKHLLYASSSSVYGANTEMPFSVHQSVNHPLSLYAASKKSNEMMAHTYSNLFGLPTTGLRFFTVYGPWGRPDMALFLFTKAILEGKPIQLFNNGDMMRDFTYIDDIVEGIVRLAEKPAQPNPDWDGHNPDPGSSYAPYRLYNIGSHSPIHLGEYVSTLERKLGIEAIKEYLPMQPGDVPGTFADVDDLWRDVDFKPSTSIDEGIGNFVQWYRNYYGV
ncbi:NAD-dependent epimerase [Tumebacillus permanentifrigoris]|uniref:UDP-glucuronate 4-epimerase n=1 Tax=Tumebacillus permanentifrigoris TaxID=378543 RepID=A0A316D7B6_9BACL|nr:NAD-dependent epimerase [Tumebacillus permanentifrigoris]PWK09685.1 UDP-glucuronate 4-epimerase [Tumebacillus permanentifrigoris]